MTLEEVHEAVAEIRRYWEKERDYEAAHGKEDDLHERFIKHVAETCKGTPLGEMAEVVLSTSAMGFDRHCA